MANASECGFCSIISNVMEWKYRNEHWLILMEIEILWHWKQIFIVLGTMQRSFSKLEWETETGFLVHLQPKALNSAQKMQLNSNQFFSFVFFFPQINTHTRTQHLIYLRCTKWTFKPKKKHWNNANSSIFSIDRKIKLR